LARENKSRYLAESAKDAKERQGNIMVNLGALCVLARDKSKAGISQRAQRTQRKGRNI